MLNKLILEYFNLIHNRDCFHDWSVSWDNLDKKARFVEEQIIELIEQEEN
ncbi:hypothetical protein [Pectobacterium phage PcaP2EGY]